MILKKNSFKKLLNQNELANEAFIGLMKPSLILITFFFCFISFEAISQSILKKTCKGELIQLDLSGHTENVNIQWQESSDAFIWSNITDATQGKLEFVSNVTNYYRAKLTESNCPAYYSDSIWLVVDTIAPVAMPANDITLYTFNANWNNLEGAKGYLMDVASDSDFKELVLNGFNVGDVNSYVMGGVNCNSKYYYRVSAYFNDLMDSLSCKSNIIQLTTDTCPLPAECTLKSTCEGNLIDSRDNKTYKTVQIRNQCWMAQNLNVGAMGLGPVAQSEGIDNQNSSIEKYCYGDVASNCDKFGGLYLWDEMMAYGVSKIEAPGPQGICPSGWHIPTDVEVVCLEKALGGAKIAGGQLKDTLGWDKPNTGASNSTGFSGISGGYRGYSGTYDNIGTLAYFWTATESSTTNAWLRFMYHNRDETVRGNLTKKFYGYTVRCVKN